MAVNRSIFVLVVSLSLMHCAAEAEYVEPVRTTPKPKATQNSKSQPNSTAKPPIPPPAPAPRPAPKSPKKKFSYNKKPVNPWSLMLIDFTGVTLGKDRGFEISAGLGGRVPRTQLMFFTGPSFEAKKSGNSHMDLEAAFIHPWTFHVAFGGSYGRMLNQEGRTWSAYATIFYVVSPYVRHYETAKESWKEYGVKIKVPIVTGIVLLIAAFN